MKKILILFGSILVGQIAYAATANDLTVLGKVVVAEQHVSTVGKVASIWFIDGSTFSATDFTLLKSSVVAIRQSTSTLETFLSQRTVVFADEGTPLGGSHATLIDCAGANITCSQSGSTVTVSIVGSAAAVSDNLGSHVATRPVVLGNFGITQSTGLEVGRVQFTLYMTTVTTALDFLKVFTSTVQSDIDFFKTFSSTVQVDIDKYKTFSSTTQTAIDFIKISLSTHSLYDVALATTITGLSNRVVVSTTASHSQFTTFTSTIDSIIEAIRLSTTAVSVAEGPDISERTYYVRDESTGAMSTYRLLSSSPAVSGEVTRSQSITSGDGLIRISSHITPSNDPGVRRIPAGVWSFTSWVSASILNGVTQLVVTVSTISVDGAVSGEVVSSTSTDIEDTSSERFDLFAIQTQDVFISTSDRLLVQYFFRTTSALGVTASLYYSGTARFTHITSPIGAVYKFVQLADAPDSLMGQNGKYLGVNDDQTALVFVSTPLWSNPDSFGNPISTRPITSPRGVEISSGIVFSTLNVYGLIQSTSGALLDGATVQGRLVINSSITINSAGNTFTVVFASKPVAGQKLGITQDVGERVIIGGVGDNAGSGSGGDGVPTFQSPSTGPLVMRSDAGVNYGIAASSGIEVGNGLQLTTYMSTSDAQQTKFVNFRSTTDSDLTFLKTYTSTASLRRDCRRYMASTLLAGGTDFAGFSSTNSAGLLLPQFTRSYNETSTDTSRTIDRVPDNVVTSSDVYFRVVGWPRTPAASKNVYFVFQTTAAKNDGGFFGPMRNYHTSTATVADLPTDDYQMVEIFWKETMTNLSYTAGAMTRDGWTRGHNPVAQGAGNDLTGIFEVEYCEKCYLVNGP